MCSLAVRLSRRALLVLAALAVAATTTGADAVNRDRHGVALGGYDPVAYFAAGQPVKGDKAISVAHDGTTYYFASAANRDAFAKEPARYLPQFGGFCAWAVSRGYTAPTDPLAWRIVDGRLFLNYSRDVQKMWEGDVPGNIEKGDANWPGLRQK